jgi:Bacterial PH domain
MSINNHGHEHELEPQYGLPERLPAGERILWQGSPDLLGVALRVFHLRKVAIYFGLMLAWRVGSLVNEGASLFNALLGSAVPVFLALMALAALAGLAFMTARTTVYTLTNKRVVMRIGIVLTLALNVPLRIVASAALRKPGSGKEGAGDIVMQLSGKDHMAWLNLWPHVRPWRLAQPEPMLRAVPNAAFVAQLLTQAWSEQTGVAVQAPMVPQPVAVQAANPVHAPAQVVTNPWPTSPTPSPT